jgi:hypothetical protein
LFHMSCFDYLDLWAVPLNWYSMFHISGLWFLFCSP